MGKSQKTILAKPSLPRQRRGISPKQGENNIVILALETSCDETAAAVLSIDLSPSPSPSHSTVTKAMADRQGREETGWPKTTTLSSIARSQTKLHSKMGGVVPEAAARAHVKYIRPVVEKALHASRFTLHAIDYIAVTVGPGLIPSLLVGVEFTKALSFATGKPIIPVNHHAGHLYSPFGTLSLPLSPRGRGRGEGVFPMISLIVSGGHTLLVLMKDIKNYKVLGRTLDDAAGEAFDKVAKMLKLPYPGGPEVSKLADAGNPNAINFPRPMLSHKNYNFSFSGLKTAVLYYLRDHKLRATSYQLRANICASFQQAVVDVLVAKTLRAAQEFGARSISLSGGVAANISLRDKLKVESEKLVLSEVEGLKVKFFVPPMHLCTDNAEMIGLAAAFMLKNGFRPVSYKKVQADSNLEL
ncbi:MAG: tRNA (adenosine(37)-N6)-threonylcarbamoyltransferase complex transferase subunit TsaD [Patescibacteria group bacterium]